mmetsp:Transcript_7683/g.16396  ORF Transcript_7683/g.16396 Transcript_7683/m.16396 type:complete len:491 (+) Transcript_7683:40-1512(+)
MSNQPPADPRKPSSRRLGAPKEGERRRNENGSGILHSRTSTTTSASTSEVLKASTESFKARENNSFRDASRERNTPREFLQRTSPHRLGDPRRRTFSCAQDVAVSLDLEQEGARNQTAGTAGEHFVLGSLKPESSVKSSRRGRLLPRSHSFPCRTGAVHTSTMQQQPPRTLSPPRSRRFLERESPMHSQQAVLSGGPLGAPQIIRSTSGSCISRMKSLPPLTRFEEQVGVDDDLDDLFSNRSFGMNGSPGVLGNEMAEIGGSAANLEWDDLIARRISLSSSVQKQHTNSSVADSAKRSTGLGSSMRLPVRFNVDASSSSANLTFNDLSTTEGLSGTWEFNELQPTAQPFASEDFRSGSWDVGGDSVGVRADISTIYPGRKQSNVFGTFVVPAELKELFIRSQQQHDALFSWLGDELNTSSANESTFEPVECNFCERNGIEPFHAEPDSTSPVSNQPGLNAAPSADCVRCGLILSDAPARSLQRASRAPNH